MYFLWSSPVNVLNLIMKGPSQVFKTSIIEEVFRVSFQPLAQLFDTCRPGLRQPVPVTVHKDSPKGGVHHGGKLLSVLSQLQHIRMKHMYINMHNQDCKQINLVTQDISV